MAFTGYLFPDLSSVPCESPPSSPSVAWALSTASSLGCPTLVGYPRLDPLTNAAHNSLAIALPGGALHSVADKHHLFAADETWAAEGKGFHPVADDIVPGVRVAVAVCMDINPRQFKAPFDAFEFAHHARGVDLVLFSSCVPSASLGGGRRRRV
jgi:protein N-terminal amidase